jgi:clorobiocin biosynthesis protein CloN6
MREVQYMRELPRLNPDLLLLHPPAVFEFRGRDDIYFPFLGTSGDVPITPLYEYFPIGFKTLQRFLGDRGHDVSIINLSTLFLKYPDLSIETLLASLFPRLIGIDLHWMVHVQGALEVAKRIKSQRPELPIIFGGISSTYYARELIAYPFIDMVMRGYDTHEPMHMLLQALNSESHLSAVPNLLWKSRSGEIVDNGFDYTPDSFGCGVDWRQGTPAPQKSRTLPIREFLTTQNAGCAYNCGWCGGSREAFRRVFGRQKAMARRPAGEVTFEFEHLKDVPLVEQYHLYSVGSYNETRQGMDRFIDLVGEAGLKSVSYEQFHLTPDDVLRKMAAANKRTLLTLSPESHDHRVATLAGRGVYTNEQLEAWLAKAIAIGIFQIDIWYFIGMPEQDESSVWETVEYAERLLKMFKGTNVNPMICPMIPFLDPASTFFERPSDHGYRVFYRTVEEHRRGMLRASIINRTNYETRWLSRRELVGVGFRAVRRLMQAKAELGALPRGWVRNYVAQIDDALQFIDVVHDADSRSDEPSRAAALRELGPEILARNTKLLSSGVVNQAFPVNRDIGGRWFDELGWPADVIERTLQDRAMLAGSINEDASDLASGRMQ